MCLGKECGDDGCGATCGDCPDGWECSAEGFCSDPNACLEDCVDKDCGTDGCGGICGTCPFGWNCTANGHCLDPNACTPDCLNKECGDNGCGGVCGSCGIEYECQEGICVEPCVGNCFNKECGSDGCDGNCGTCAEDESCDEGLCLPSADGESDVVAPEEVWSYEDTSGSGSKDGVGGFVLEDVEGSGQFNDDECPEGEEKRYGKCVPVAAEGDTDGEGDKAGGCSSATVPAPSSLWLLLVLLALLAARRLSSSET